MRVRRGWIALLTLVTVAGIAACGAPEVTDISNNGSGSPGGTTPGGSGTPGGSPTASGTGSGTPNPNPTITNVPSFATWQSTIRGYECAQCHSGGSGGFSFGTQTDSINEHFFWFETICNNANQGGVQNYNPPTGHFLTTMCAMDGSHPVSAGSTAACNAIKAWMQAATVTATPPDCNSNVDYVDSH
ncbi:MAG TPA: hypothetical protein VMV18_11190 [bacterium]|nr:hypothetical protein [bacterium]